MVRIRVGSPSTTSNWMCTLFSSLATVVSTVVVSVVDGDEIGLVTTGVYTDQVKKTGDDWQISERQLDLDKAF